MKILQKTFSLTDHGARGMTIASIASFFVNIGYMACMILFFFFAQDILDDGMLSSLSNYLIAIVAAVAFTYLALDWEYRATYNSTYMEARDLRISIADTLKNLPLGYLAQHDLSDLAQTMMQDVLDLEHAFSHAIPQTFGAGAFLLLMIIGIFFQNAWVALAIFVPFALAVGVCLFSKSYQKYCAKRYFDARRKNIAILQEAIDMQQEIRSYNLVDSKRKQIHEAIDQAEKLQMKQELGQGVPVLSAQSIAKLSLALTVLATAWLLIQGEMNALFVIGYLIAVTRMLGALEGISMNIGELFHIDVRLDRIKELKATRIQEGEPTTFENYDIEVKNLSFAYGERPVLEDVDFCAQQGHVTALVGPSGSGKTTMIRLLSRLYDYDQGVITLGGHPLKAIAPACLYSQISMVFQEVTLFNGTVMENIRIGRQDATDEEVIQAARKAHCEEFILKLPEGYQTMIGENGSKLSGGERQRLSIARAFLKDAPILLLDEISASLDVENEMAIQKSLNELIKNKTVIIISHRMKSIEDVDQIVVFEEGRINGVGTHQQLMESSDLYRRLVEKSRLTESYVY
ncbi:ABC transporter ATP-binding protein/permease [Collinsella sp. AGMB00827]|uniref:ABC transporter ATP-binding protein/permease n=1 Tax=Collinsella ureilytica TaxID=2869515 RepID=A0ABS7MKD8_9ACTN|nr:ABC transporter ATP-binding protein [Collinsella urealyticum]MBY4797541.1 ABC transporter ATP-binding protein/permease [Collinsella urealyticum]